jgi:hypothetical protein
MRLGAHIGGHAAGAALQQGRLVWKKTKDGLVLLSSVMLEHNECPRCGAPNLDSEVCCFACGARLKALPKRYGPRPAGPAPWPLWVGLLIALALFGLVAYYAVSWLAGYRDRAALPPWYLLAGGFALVVAGQVAFWEARRRDARSWRLRRAPELPLSRAHTGDAVWARGKVVCDTPVVPAYFPQECAYYHYVLREREQGEAGWRVSDRQTKAVDFRLMDGDEAVYVPSGCVRFDAPVYVETYVDPGATMQVKLWAIPVGLRVSLCGRIAGQTSRPRVDALGDDLLGVVTWRSPPDYVRVVARRARLALLAGWALTVGGVLSAIAGIISGS